MSWVYICENCGYERYPQERLEDEACSICGKPMKPKYVCRHCNYRIEIDESMEDYDCPNCGRPIPVGRSKSPREVKEAKRKSFGKVTMKGDEITIEMEDNEIKSLKGVEEVTLNTSEEEVARVENPDFAEFTTVEKFEEDENGVQLYLKTSMSFESQEREEILKKIKEIDWVD